MRRFRLFTSSALLASMCLAPLGAAETAADNASDAGRDHRSDVVQHADRDHPNWPKVCHCETDKDRDALRDKLKTMSEDDRKSFLEKLHDYMDERKERLDHLCDCIRKHPHLSEERKQELLAIINEKREEIRERMKEFFANQKERYEHHVEMAKLGDKLEDLRSFIRNHPCLSDEQKERLKAKLADLKEDIHNEVVEWREDHPAAGNHDGNGGGDGGSSAISNEQKEALAARMAAIKKDKADLRQDVHQDVGDIKEDRKDIHEDRVDLHQDYKDLKDDTADHNKVEVKQDAKDIKDDRQDLHQDQKDLVKDHVDLRQDLRETGRPGLTDEQKERLKARLDQARDNRDGGEKIGDRPQLTDEQKEKLKARMDQARDNRDGAAQDKRQDLQNRRDGIQDRRDNAGPRGNNGLGNGDDPQPAGDPKVNDGPGAGPGRPGARLAK